MAPLHLRLANLRRWLNKRTNNNNPTLLKSDTIELYNIINNQKLILILANDSLNKWDVIIQEKVSISADITKWYIIECGFKNSQKAETFCKQIAPNCQCVVSYKVY